MIPEDTIELIKAKREIAKASFVHWNVSSEVRDWHGRWVKGGKVDNPSGNHLKTYKVPTERDKANWEERTGMKFPEGWHHTIINMDPNAKVQAMGIDNANKVQPRYSKVHHAESNVEKHARIKKTFTPKLKNKLDDVLKKNVMKDDTHAAVAIMHATGMRIDTNRDSETVKGINTYGASTLERRHAKIQKIGGVDHAVFTFVPGKPKIDKDTGKAKTVTMATDNSTVVSAVKSRLSSPGAPTDKLLPTANSFKSDKLLMGMGIQKNHDLRTHFATSRAQTMIDSIVSPTKPSEFKKLRAEVGDYVGSLIGDSRGVTLNSYINPQVFDKWKKSANVEKSRQANEIHWRPIQSGNQLARASRRMGDIRQRTSTGRRLTKDEPGSTDLHVEQPLTVKRKRKGKKAKNVELTVIKQRIMDQRIAKATKVPKGIHATGSTYVSPVDGNIYTKADKAEKDWSFQYNNNNIDHYENSNGSKTAVCNTPGGWPVWHTKNRVKTMEKSSEMSDRQADIFAALIEKYDTSPLGNGKNWVTRAGGLPLFVRAVAHALMRKGHTESDAIAIAVSDMKKGSAGVWGQGRHGAPGKATPPTQIKSAASTAHWEEMKAKGGGGKSGGKVGKEESDLVTSMIVKTDLDKHTVFGWAYVTHDQAGQLNIDKSGEFVDDPTELEDAAYHFVLDSRKGGHQHARDGDKPVVKSTMIESMVTTPDKMAAMGIPEGTLPVGWWTGWKVHDDDMWNEVTSGKATSFSIHGSGTRAKAEL